MFHDFSLQPHSFHGFPANLLRLDYVSTYDAYSDWALVLGPSEENVKTWVIVIHGHGSKGNQLYIRPDIQRYWLPEFQRRAYGILTPTLRGNAWMGPAAVHDLDALLQFLRENFAAERFIFSSGSMGGTSNLIYAGLRPDNVDGIVARGAITELSTYYDYCKNPELSPNKKLIKEQLKPTTLNLLREIAASIEESYGGKPSEKADLYKLHSPLYQADKLLNKSIFLSHGTEDILMPVSQTRHFAAAMAENPNFTYVEIPGGNHDSPLTLGLTDPCPDNNFAAFNALNWVDP